MHTEGVGVFLGMSECYSITAYITPIPSLVKNSLLLLFVLAWPVQPHELGLFAQLEPLLVALFVEK